MKFSACRGNGVEGAAPSLNGDHGVDLQICRTVVIVAVIVELVLGTIIIDYNLYPLGTINNILSDFIIYIINISLTQRLIILLNFILHFQVIDDYIVKVLF